MQLRYRSKKITNPYNIACYLYDAGNCLLCRQTPNLAHKSNMIECHRCNYRIDIDDAELSIALIDNKTKNKTIVHISEVRNGALKPAGANKLNKIYQFIQAN